MIYFVNLGRWDLWNPDEPRHAEVAREMTHGGDWILMHYNGNVYSDKPPLFFWLIGFSSYLWQGFTSFSVRFPSAFFGTLTVLLTFLIGKHLFNSRTGFLGSLVLATSFEFVYLSSRANIDTTLTFFTTASLFCFFLWDRQHKEEKKHREKDLNRFIIYGFYAGMAFATLAKGPVGFLLPLLVCFSYLILQKDWQGFREMKLFPGMLLFLGMVFCWYLPAVWKGGRDYLNETLFLHSLARYSQGGAKGQPIYYYLYDFPTGFFPWVVFLPSAFVYAYSMKNLEKRREFLFLGIWFMVIFFFFSLSKGKRGIYLLPLFPAVSLLVGRLLHDFITSQLEHLRQRWISLPLTLLLGLIFVSGVVLPWVVSMEFPSYTVYSFPLTFLLTGGSLAMFIFYRFKNLGMIFLLFFGILTAGYFYTTRAIFPLINPYKSARFISREVLSRIQPGEKLAVYGRVSTAPYNFYTGIVPILDLAGPLNLFQFLNSPEKVFCLISFDEFRKIQKRGGEAEIHLVARHPVEGNDVVLISNRFE